MTYSANAPGALSGLNGFTNAGHAEQSAAPSQHRLHARHRPARAGRHCLGALPRQSQEQQCLPHARLRNGVRSAPGSGSGTFCASASAGKQQHRIRKRTPSHSVLYPAQESLCLNKQYATRLLKIQTLGHFNLWVLIQKFQKCTVLFSESYFTKNSLLNVFIPHDTTTKNQQKVLGGYEQMDARRIKPKPVPSVRSYLCFTRLRLQQRLQLRKHLCLIALVPGG